MRDKLFAHVALWMSNMWAALNVADDELRSNENKR